MPANSNVLSIRSVQYSRYEMTAQGISVRNTEEGKPVVDLISYFRGTGDIAFGFGMSGPTSIIVDYCRQREKKNYPYNKWECVYRQDPEDDTRPGPEWADALMRFQELEAKRMGAMNHPKGALLQQAWARMRTLRLLNHRETCCDEIKRCEKDLATETGAALLEAMHSEDCAFFEELSRWAKIVTGIRRGERESGMTIQETAITAAVVCWWRGRNNCIDLRSGRQGKSFAQEGNPTWEDVKAEAIRLGAKTQDWSTVQKECHLKFLGTGQRGRKKGASLSSPKKYTPSITTIRPMTEEELRAFEKLQGDDNFV